MMPSGDSGMRSSAETSCTPWRCSSRLYIGASNSLLENLSIMYTTTRSDSPAEEIMRWNSGRSSVRPDTAWSQYSRTTSMPSRAHHARHSRSWSSMDASRCLLQEKRA